MKTIIHHSIQLAGLLIIILFSSIQSRSQQLITFKNGNSLKAVITYQTKDSVRYYIMDDPSVYYGDTMDHILKIESLIPVRESKQQGQPPLKPVDKEYMKYKRNTTTGGVMLGTGAIIGVAGVIGWGSTNKAENANQVLGAVFSIMGMFIGSGLVISGGIILIVNSVSLSQYKTDHSLSLKVNCNPQTSGVSLVYNF
jgi:hypothetical protein